VWTRVRRRPKRNVSSAHIIGVDLGNFLICFFGIWSQLFTEYKVLLLVGGSVDIPNNQSGRYMKNIV
jgi:hypothetical protein